MALNSDRGDYGEIKKVSDKNEFYVNKNGGFLEELVTEIEKRKAEEESEERLDELLSKCTPENAHEEINFGAISGDTLRRVLPKLNSDIISVGFKRLSEGATIPAKAHPSDSGFDLHAAEDVIIEPGETKVIPTGIAVKMPAGYEATVRPRSGVTSQTKLRVQLGTIDQAYRGEIGIIVDNINGEFVAKQSGYMTIKSEYDFIENGKVFPKAFTYKIRKGDRIAQLVIQPLPAVEAYEIEGDIEQTERGVDGFGSSGVSSEVKETDNQS